MNVPMPPAMTMERGDEHRVLGGEDAQAAVGQAGEFLGGLVEQPGRSEALRLVDEGGDQVAASDGRETGDVVDQLLRVERGDLAAGFGQCVDHGGAQFAKARVVGRVQAGRAGTHDQQVDLDHDLPP